MAVPSLRVPLVLVTGHDMDGLPGSVEIDAVPVVRSGPT